MTDNIASKAIIILLQTIRTRQSSEQINSRRKTFQYETRRANDDKKARTKSTGLCVCVDVSSAVSFCHFCSAAAILLFCYFVDVNVQWAHRLGSSTRTIFNTNERTNKNEIKNERIFPIATHHWRDGTRQRLAFCVVHLQQLRLFTILSSTEFSLLRFAAQHAEPAICSSSHTLLS